MVLRVQAAAVPVAKVAAMEAAHKAVEGENKRIQAELEEKTTELAELKTMVWPCLFTQHDVLSFPVLYPVSCDAQEDR